MMLISVIILDWNGKYEECWKSLESALRQKYSNKEVIFIDNGSETDVYIRLLEEFPDVQFFQTGENLGCPEGRNWGASKSKGDILVFLENDGFWENPNVLDNMYKYFKEYDLLGALYTSVKGPNNVNKDLPADGLKKYLHEQDTISSLFRGGASAIRKKLFFDCGGFPGFYFRQGEEEWLSYKIYNNGYYILYAPAMELIHYGSAYEKKNRIVALNTIKNRLITKIRLFPLFRAVAFVIPRYVHGVVRLLLKGRLSDVLILTVDVFKAIRDRSSGDIISVETIKKIEAIKKSDDFLIVNYDSMKSSNSQNQ